MNTAALALAALTLAHALIAWLAVRQLRPRRAGACRAPHDPSAD